jgi:hypothetical protein
LGVASLRKLLEKDLLIANASDANNALKSFAEFEKSVLNSRNISEAVIPGQDGTKTTY